MTKRSANGVNRASVVAIVGHRSVGKTSLADLLLCTVGATRSLGRVDDGTAFMDVSAVERRRALSLWSSTAWFDRENARISIIDVPGSSDFRFERNTAVWGSDATLLVVDEVDEVSPGALEIVAHMNRHESPVMIVINKLETIHRHHVALPAIQRGIKRKLIYPQQPLVDEDGRLVGIVDVIRGVGVRYALDGTGAFSEEPLTVKQAAKALVARDVLVERVAMTDDALLERFLEEFELSNEQVYEGIRSAVASSQLVPVLLTSAVRAIGGEQLVDAMFSWMPSSAEDAHSELALQHITSQLDEKYGPVHWLRVVKGTIKPNEPIFPFDSCRGRQYYQLRGGRRSRATYLGPGALLAVYSPVATRSGEVSGGLRESPTPPPYAMRFGLAVDDEKQRGLLLAALKEVAQLDPAVSVSSEMIIALHGRLHLDRWLDVIERTRGIKAHAYEPPIAYRERLVGAVEGVQGIHELMVDGEVSEFGQVTLSVAPHGLEMEVVCSVDEGLADDAIPEKFIDALSGGIVAGAQKGPMAGLPVMGMDVRIMDGEYDMFQSKEGHFWAAGSNAITQAIRDAGTEVVEPWSVIHASVPAQSVGTLLADAVNHEARVIDVEVDAQIAVVTVEYPEREVQQLRVRFAAITSGLGSLTVSHRGYRKMPEHLLRQFQVPEERHQDKGSR
jgi:elongation factor G